MSESVSRSSPDPAEASPANGAARPRRRRAWIAICALDGIVPDTGVCALVAGRQVAIFRVGEAAYALDNRDPFTGAQVLSRGLVTGRGGTLAVASPLHKQRFALGTGVCVEDGTTRVEIYRCRVRDGIIEVETPAR